MKGGRVNEIERRAEEKMKLDEKGGNGMRERKREAEKGEREENKIGKGKKIGRDKEEHRKEREEKGRRDEIDREGGSNEG